MYHVGNWGKIYKDDTTDDDSFSQRKLAILYWRYQRMGAIESSERMFKKFLDGNEKYPDELKEELLKDFTDNANTLREEVDKNKDKAMDKLIMERE